MLIRLLASLITQIGRFINEPAKCSNEEIHFTSGAIGVFYQMGIAKYLKERYQTECYTYSGVSAGSWCGMMLASDISTEELDNVIYGICGKLGEGNFWLDGPYVAKKMILNTDFNVDYSRIKIGITQFNPFPEKKYVDNFRNKSDVIEACIASSHIPLLSGQIATTYNNSYSIDGGIMLLGGDLVKTGALFCFPPDIWGKEYNRETFYDFSEESAIEMYKEGYKDTKKNRHCLDQFIARRKSGWIRDSAII
tara:strand:+ start:100 stop:852 length:753 start_codon:yes stop_codon:yes gene_type:complete